MAIAAAPVLAAAAAQAPVANGCSRSSGLSSSCPADCHPAADHAAARAAAVKVLLELLLLALLPLLPLFPLLLALPLLVQLQKRQWLLMVLSAVLPAVRVASARAAAGALAPGAAARAAVANGHRVQGNQSPTKQPSFTNCDCSCQRPDDAPD